MYPMVVSIRSRSSSSSVLRFRFSRAVTVVSKARSARSFLSFSMTGSGMGQTGERGASPFLKNDSTRGKRWSTTTFSPRSRWRSHVVRS